MEKASRIIGNKWLKAGLGLILLTFAVAAGLYHFLFYSSGDLARTSDPFAQVTPGIVAYRSDLVWMSRGLRRFNELTERRDALEPLIEKDFGETEGAAEPVELPEGEKLGHGSYGVLPTVYVDKSYGAVFPVPLESPTGFSWHDILVASDILVELAEKLESVRSLWVKTPPRERLKEGSMALKRYQWLDSSWSLLNSQFAKVASRVRYMKFWQIQLLRAWHAKHRSLDEILETVRSGKRTRISTPDTGLLLGEAMANRDQSDRSSRIWDALSEVLRPFRVQSFSYLPDKLPEPRKGKKAVIAIPMVTDIKDKRFLREFEGAIESHWNQSPWAEAKKVRFRLKWRKIGLDRDFLIGKTGLDGHLQYLESLFPPDKEGLPTTAFLTTGGASTFVRKSFLVLGPGSVTPRTLAHEFGHVLGFDDCYYRTLSANGRFGLLGLSILEWTNPIYGDDLMCDNNQGVARSEVW